MRGFVGLFGASRADMDLVGVGVGCKKEVLGREGEIWTQIALSGLGYRLSLGLFERNIVHLA